MDTIVISVGGSIIVPDRPDYFFLREFKNFVIRHEKRFIIVCGGGKTNSYYNEAAKRVSNISSDDLDWIGIMATRLNAELVRAVFGKLAHPEVIYDPHQSLDFKEKVLIAAGWKPGCSTDYDAVLLAKRFKVKEILNLTNISYVYDKDPKLPDATKLFEVSWKEYRKIIGNKWTPRLNSPFDPVASREAQKSKIKVAVLKGTNIKNVENYINGKIFEGTVIK
jgi:uridylate kinase